jgi:hypothetical protein
MKIEKSHVVGDGLHEVGNYMMYEVGDSLKRVQPQTARKVEYTPALVYHYSV